MYWQARRGDPLLLQSFLSINAVWQFQHDAHEVDLIPAELHSTLVAIVTNTMYVPSIPGTVSSAAEHPNNGLDGLCPAWDV